MSAIFGRILPLENLKNRLILGFFWLFSVSGILAAIGFYTLKIDYDSAAIWFLTTLIIGIFASWGPAKTIKIPEKQKNSAWPSFLFFAVTIGFAGLLIFGLHDLAITSGVRSFWPVVDPIFWLFFGMIICFAILSTLKFPRSFWTLFDWIIVVFVLVSSALVIFPLGYGFDGFIHRATENYIIENGTISPKPLYYSGQYGLLTFIALLTKVPIDFLDTIALPFLTTLIAPLIMFVFGKKIAPKNPTFGFLLLAILPLTSFIATTPQGIGNLWVLLSSFFLAILNLLNISRRKFLILATPPLLFTFFLHPISGIPLLFFGFIMFVFQKENEQKKLTKSNLLFVLITILSSVSLPFLFITRAIMNGEKVNLPNFYNTLFVFKNDLYSLLIRIQTWESVFLNTEVILSVLSVIGFVALCIIGYKQIVHKKAYLLTVISVGLTYFFLVFFVDFSFLISYEARSYADRLVPILIYLISPVAFWGVNIFVKKISESKKHLKIAGVLIVCLFFVSNWFNTYPREDSFVRNGGFTVSETDIKTVQEIAATKSISYVVLTNQNVGAAALKTFGFFSYYGSVFAYPIPTGDPLYQIFLKMNENPDIKTAMDAASLANNACKKTSCPLAPVQDVFFAVPNWWWQSGKIIETAKTNADEWWSINDDSMIIFRYKVGL